MVCIGVFRAFVAIGMIALLMGSGGGGGSPVSAPPAAADPSPDPGPDPTPDPVSTFAIAGFSLNTASASISRQTGTMTTGETTVTLDGVSVVIDEGASAAGSVHSGFLVPGSLANVFVATEPTVNLPTSGAVTYTGRAAYSVVLPTSRVDLSSGVSVDVDFGSGRADLATTPIDLSGQTVSLAGVTPYSATAVERFEIDDIKVENGRLVADSTTGAHISGFGASSQSMTSITIDDLDGQFGGANAEELAGAAALSATNGAAFLVFQSTQ